MRQPGERRLAAVVDALRAHPRLGSQLTHVQVLRSNNLAAGLLVAHHLAELGHRRIGFVGGPKHSIDSQHRERGLREGLARRGIRLDPAQVFSCSKWDVEAGSAFAVEFLSQPLEVTALVMANDALAFGFMGVALRPAARRSLHRRIRRPTAGRPSVSGAHDRVAADA